MKTKEKVKSNGEQPIAPAVPARTAQRAVPTTIKPDEFKMIRRADLFPDPDQPRKTFNQEPLQQLAASIREQGIVQPLIVRFVPAKYKLREPDLHSKEWHVEERLDDLPGVDTNRTWAHAFQGTEEKCRNFAGEQNLTDRFVIVAGERRWRAAAIAGLDELPCVVRDVDGVSDTGKRRKFAQQWIENNQRESVSAIEEAEALDREFKRRKQSEPELAAEAFAKENGMSRADFYGTLVLTRLHKPVRDALVAGKISPSLAKVVAMVPEPKQQEKLLAVLTDEESWQYPFSVRDAQDLVDEKYVKNLNEAPFKKASGFPWSKEYPESVKATVAGIPNAFVVSTCEECPHRSGNMVEAFPELAKRPNVCTNVHCFSLKCKAHWLRTAEHKKEAGEKVMTETEFRRVKGQYVRSDDRSNAQGSWYESWGTVVGKQKPAAAFVATKDGLVTVYPKDEALAAAKKNGHKFDTSTTQTPEEKAKAAEKEKREEEQGLRRQKLVLDLVGELEAGIRKLKGEASWELAAMLMSDNGSFDHGLVEHFEGNRDPRVSVLGQLFGRNYPLTWKRSWNEDGVKAWKFAGVDLVAAFDAAEKEVQKGLALPAGKKELKQGTLLEVKKNKTKKKGKR